MILMDRSTSLPFWIEVALLQDAVSQVQQATGIKESHDRRGNLKMGNCTYNG